MADADGEESHPPRRGTSPVDQHRAQQSHGVAAGWVPDRLDVGLCFRVDRRGDRNTLRVVNRGIRSHRPDDRLRVGAHVVAESRRKVGKPAVFPKGMEQPRRPQSPAGKDHVSGSERAGTFVEPGAGSFGRDPIPSPVERLDIDRLMLGVDHGAVLLGQVEIVLVQGVLGVVPAPDHASTAFDTPGPGRAFTAEVGIGFFNPFHAKMHGNRSQGEALGDPEMICNRAKHAVRSGFGRDALHPQHASCLVEVGSKFGLPVGDVAPLRITQGDPVRFVADIAPHQRAAADPGTGQSEGVIEQTQPLNAPHPEFRKPEELAEVPIRGR